MPTSKSIWASQRFDRSRELIVGPLSFNTCMTDDGCSQTGYSRPKAFGIDLLSCSVVSTTHL